MPTLSDFKNNFNGGSRSNRFFIEGEIPSFSSPSSTVSSQDAFTKFHVRSTQIPQLSTKTLSYDYFGRKYHYPGEKDYGTWSFTVLDDTGDAGDLWKRFNQWQEAINSNYDNYSFVQSGASSTGSDSALYKANNWRIQHMGLNGENDPYLKTFILHGCWPTAINPISFNMGNANSLNMFAVVMVYDYIEISSSGGAITDS
jgi:hypothetical protein